MATAVSLFSGCGGSDTGVHKLGIDILMANDIIPYARDVYLANLPQTDYILKDVDLDSVAQLVVSRETFELGQVSHWGYSCLFKVTHKRLCCMLLSGFLETELKSIVAVMFTCLDLSNHTRTQFDNSAWRIYTIGTENGSHSDFLS